jgi:DNA modification methylase
MIDIKLHKLIKQYEVNYKPVHFDFRSKLYEEISAHFNDGKKNLHYIHPYPGRVSPHIPFVILSLKEFEGLEGRVLDPFAGTGTVLLESIINPFKNRSALGVEINPLARLISKVKTSFYDIQKLEQHFNKIKISFYSLKNNDFEYVDFQNIDIWFSSKAIKKLSKLKFAITDQRISKEYKDFFWVCFSRIIRRVAKADPRIPPPVILKPAKYEGNLSVHEKLVKYLSTCEDPPVWEYFKQAFIDNCKLANYQGKTDLFSTDIYAQIIGDEATELNVNYLNGCGRINKKESRKLSKGSVDIILTSPPYMSAQKYIRSTKLELFWLGYTSQELLAFEKNTIGSEYVRLEKNIKKLGVKLIDELISWTYERSKERGVMIHNYFEKMDLVIKELFRVLRTGGYAIFIVGDNKILNKRIRTYELLLKLAESNGFKSCTYT